VFIGKKTDNGLYLNYKPNHPHSIKHGIATTLYHHTNTHSSNEEKKKKKKSEET
jgi:hypothetical protein